MKTWSLRLNSVTRQVTFSMPKFKRTNATFSVIFKNFECVFLLTDNNCKFRNTKTMYEKLTEEQINRYVTLCLKITEKILIQHCERSLRFEKNQKWSIWPEACGQEMLPDKIDRKCQNETFWCFSDNVHPEYFSIIQL